MDTGAGESFSRSSRLTLAGEYKQVFQNNIRVSDDCFTLLVGKDQGLKSRIGFAVAKKQLKRAVDRNKVKRLIRESFRLHQNDLPNLDIVVMVRFKISQLNNQQIFARLDKHWRKVIKQCEKF
jgi:ribonuclease P protein component